MTVFGGLFDASTLSGWRRGNLEGAYALLAMQGAALGAMAPLATNWLHRREDSLAAARDLLDALEATDDPTAAVRAQLAWFSGAAQRLSEDRADWLRFVTALWRLLAAGVAPEPAATPSPAPHRGRAPVMVA
jgi:hypothetical protein